MAVEKLSGKKSHSLWMRLQENNVRADGTAIWTQHLTNAIANPFGPMKRFENKFLVVYIVVLGIFVKTYCFL